MFFFKRTSQQPGFTLAELLIALAILGVIATFTIPKVLVASRNGQYNAMAKEAAATVSGAYQAYKMNNTPSATTSARVLSEYINYVQIFSTGTHVDPTPNATAYPCNSSNPCLKLHNGGILQLINSTFDGTNATNTTEVRFDPDGEYGGSPGTDRPGISVQFQLYVNGQIMTRGQAKPGSCNSVACPFGAQPNLDPSWFSWN